MKETEIVAVANASDLAEDGAFAIKRLRYYSYISQAAEIGAVEAVGGEAGAREEKDGDEVAGIAVVGPVCAVEGGRPGDRLLLPCRRRGGIRWRFLLAGDYGAHCMAQCRLDGAITGVELISQESRDLSFDRRDILFAVGFEHSSHQETF